MSSLWNQKVNRVYRGRLPSMKSTINVDSAFWMAKAFGSSRSTLCSVRIDSISLLLITFLRIPSAEHILSGTGDNGYVRADSQLISFSCFVERDRSDPIMSRLTDTVDVLSPLLITLVAEVFLNDLILFLEMGS